MAAGLAIDSFKQTGQHGVAVRVLPNHADLANPYELGLILWERPGEFQDTEANEQSGQ